MRTKMTGCLLVVLLCVLHAWGGIEETVAGEKLHQKQDNIQQEILEAMKESGVLNEWKEKLDDMLFQENNEDVDEKPTSQLNPQERNMLISYLQAFLAQKKTKITPEYIVSLVDRIQKTPTIDLPQVFVHLPPLIDMVVEIADNTENVEKIIERQAPVFDSPAKTIDILHTLTENLKSELLRLKFKNANGGPAAPAPPKPKASKKQKEEGKQYTKSNKKAKKTKKEGLDLSDYLQMGSALLQDGNGAQLLKLMSGEADLSSLVTLLPQIIKSGSLKNVLGKVVGSYMDSTPMGMMGKQLLDNFLDSEQGEGVLTEVASNVEYILTSEAGKRMSQVLPKIMAAKDTQTMLEMAHKESEWYWDQFFDSIGNSDIKEKALDQLAEILVNLYDYFDKPPKDSIVAKAPLLINGLLISYRMPSYDPKNPVKSITKMANKAIKLFTSWKLDATPYIKLVSEVTYEAYQRQAKGNKLADLSFDQKKALLSRILDNEVVDPSQAVWSVYSTSVKHRHCAEHLLCQVNRREKTQHAEEARTVMTKFSSMAAAWVIANAKGVTDEGMEYFKLYKQAIWSGAGGMDCMVEHPVRNGNQADCSIFPWQNKEFMSTNYEHLEL